MGGAEARPSIWLNPARIVPRQEAVDSSNNLYGSCQTTGVTYKARKLRSRR